MQERINRWDLFKIILRSFFLQASWSFQRMQSLGFVFALAPILQKLYTSPEERVRSFLRHLRFFNTHPYFASFILGAVAQMEEKRAQTGRPTEEEIISFKTMTSGPYAAIGDAFFWGALRPFVAALGLTCMVLGGRIAFLGPVVFFIVYNLFHLQVRVMGVMWGYSQEDLAAKKIEQLNLTGLAKIFKQIALPILGGITALQLNTKDVFLEDHRLILKLCSLILILLFSRLSRQGWSIYWQVAIVGLASIILAYGL
ncbi:MAG TPA: PTS system mannose/fructose/sorbose family transporter subunit IID [Candidatus Limnocylindrales bacterium]|nr:PTS system mannose/fructose/sorbose family transporter subunit IID [Candidatus Limnocylindrales bacterium]